MRVREEGPQGVSGGQLVVVWWTETWGPMAQLLPLSSWVLLSELLFLRQRPPCLYNEDPEREMRNGTCRGLCSLLKSNLTPQILLSNYHVLGSGASVGNKVPPSRNSRFTGRRQPVNKWFHQSTSGGWMG